MRTVGVVSGSRADYGLYFPILKRIVAHPKLKLLLYVTGMHLSKRFGHTVSWIIKDGFPIASQVKISLDSDSPEGIAYAMGEGTIGFAKVFKKNPPDILLILGDRFEMHSAAVAAIPFNIPLAHIHGGELTYGSFDEYFRHSLTKMSHLHFAATKEYANRIKQMGEESWRVIICGAPGLENILSLPRYSRIELEKKFKINFSKPVILVTVHPVSIEYKKTELYISNVLEALSDYQNYSIIFTHPNADTDNGIITRRIKSFIDRRSHSFMVDNFGQRGYLSLLEHTAVMVGNSSSGIIEAASFKLPAVNIGTRQDGRIRNKNVIDVGYGVKDIQRGIQKVLSKEFRSSLQRIRNVYGDGRASERIVSTLARIDLKKLTPKRFVDYR